MFCSRYRRHLVIRSFHCDDVCWLRALLVHRPGLRDRNIRRYHTWRHWIGNRHIHDVLHGLGFHMIRSSCSSTCHARCFEVRSGFFVYIIYHMFGCMINLFSLVQLPKYITVPSQLISFKLSWKIKKRTTHFPMAHIWVSWGINDLYNRNDVCWQSMATDRSPCALCILGTIFHRFGFEFPKGLLQQSLPFTNPGLAG